MSEIYNLKIFAFGESVENNISGELCDVVTDTRRPGKSVRTGFGHSIQKVAGGNQMRSNGLFA
ncbi:hypothetical protein [Ferrimonas senticii]|uniref:hypothetical protein n=1 Tax=Ferrimonas senticii TaxID=394566 RepID=UPI0012EBD7FD|nr:hypothetical protein [Ferrimonas senticii]